MVRFAAQFPDLIGLCLDGPWQYQEPILRRVIALCPNIRILYYCADRVNDSIIDILNQLPKLQVLGLPLFLESSIHYRPEAHDSNTLILNSQLVTRLRELHDCRPRNRWETFPIPDDIQEQIQLLQLNHQTIVRSYRFTLFSSFKEHAPDLLDQFQD